MSYDSIRICRERGGFQVSATDPAIVAENRANEKSDRPSAWKDSNVEYTFETKAQVMAFLDKAMDIALPADDYSSAFDKLAKEAQKA